MFSVPAMVLLWYTKVDPIGELGNDGTESGSKEGWSVCGHRSGSYNKSVTKQQNIRTHTHTY